MHGTLWNVNVEAMIWHEQLAWQKLRHVNRTKEYFPSNGKAKYKRYGSTRRTKS